MELDIPYGNSAKLSKSQGQSPRKARQATESTSTRGKPGPKSKHPKGHNMENKQSASYPQTVTAASTVSLQVQKDDKYAFDLSSEEEACTVKRLQALCKVQITRHRNITRTMNVQGAVKNTRKDKQCSPVSPNNGTSI